MLVPTAETLAREKIGNFRLIVNFDTDGTGADINVNWEQVPNEESTITLDPDKVDPVFGQAVTHLDWNLKDEDKKTCVRALELCGEYLGKRGGRDFELRTELDGGANAWLFGRGDNTLETGEHHIGALRMSEDPDSGIVDARARVHSVDNLYIAGSSVFPTTGYANPTMTIVALSLRLADHLKDLRNR
jgi:choline dehydrogenase-like flavoprotein